MGYIKVLKKGSTKENETSKVGIWGVFLIFYDETHPTKARG